MTIIYSLIALAIILADQLVKLWTVNNTALGEVLGNIMFIADFM